MLNYLPSQPALPATHGYGVLVADDEREIRDVLEWALRREGFAVWLAADGQEAVALYRKHHESIDVLLLDVHMPRLDGPGTLAAVEKLTPNIPCCFMSGHLGRYSVVGLCTQGARVVLTKPFRIPEVAQLLRDVVDGVDVHGVVAAGERAAQSGQRPRDEALS